MASFLNSSQLGKTKRTEAGTQSERGHNGQTDTSDFTVSVVHTPHRSTTEAKLNPAFVSICSFHAPGIWVTSFNLASLEKKRPSSLSDVTNAEQTISLSHHLVATEVRQNH